MSTSARLLTGIITLSSFIFKPIYNTVILLSLYYIHPFLRSEDGFTHEKPLLIVCPFHSRDKQRAQLQGTDKNFYEPECYIRILRNSLLLLVVR